jgi:hypothetical protein
MAKLPMVCWLMTINLLGGDIVYFGTGVPTYAGADSILPAR